MEKRNIYIEHNGEWYDFSDDVLDVLCEQIKNNTFCSSGLTATDKREFEIGSLVKFESLEDWTEVIEGGFCHDSPVCIFMPDGGTKGDRECTKTVSTIKSGVSCAKCRFIKYIPETPEKPEEPSAPTEGLKHDSGKLHPRLFPMECFEAICKVLTFGEGKYSADNWKKVAPEKYIDAIWRHWIAWQTGEERDSESGLSHAAHFATNAVFLLYFELEKQKREAGE